LAASMYAGHARVSGPASKRDWDTVRTLWKSGEGEEDEQVRKATGRRDYGRQRQPANPNRCRKCADPDSGRQGWITCLSAVESESLWDTVGGCTTFWHYCGHSTGGSDPRQSATQVRSSIPEEKLPPREQCTWVRMMSMVRTACNQQASAVKILNLSS